MSWFAVAIGGAFGSMLRYGISKWLNHTSEFFPWGTFLANVFSCLVIGGAYLYFSKHTDASAAVKLGIMTGFCGGFSTFSTFSLETFQLIEQGQWGWAMVYVSGSVIVCVGLLAFIIKGLS